jgi:hypothetical protein
LGDKLGPRSKVCNIDGEEGNFKIDASGARQTRVAQVNLAEGIVIGRSHKVPTARVKNVRPYFELDLANLNIETEDGAEGGNGTPSPPTSPVTRRLPANVVIRVDSEVFEALKTHAVPLEDTANSVLRKILRLDPMQGPVTSVAAGNGMQGRPLVTKDGTTLSHGTRLRGRSQGRDHDAEVVDGLVLYKGQKYRSLSRAASEACGGASVSGPEFWSACLPGETEWVPVASLRRNQDPGVV